MLPGDRQRQVDAQRACGTSLPQILPPGSAEATYASETARVV
jgi:hypothetical protein